MSPPSCCVVIPSYNRRRELEMVLKGLCRQTTPGEDFEVIVVLDGSTDGSEDMLREWQASHRLKNFRWLWKKNGGPSAARNAGVGAANADVVIFLDDDVVPEADMVEAHLRRHRQGQRIAVLGDYPIVRDNGDSIYRIDLWAWWTDLFHYRSLPGHRPCFRDFCTGNVSLRKEDFLRVGGFDETFHGVGREDYDLGYRLMKSGVSIVADRSVKALHFHKTRTSPGGLIKATAHDAHGDVILWAKYPELRRGLYLGCRPRGIKGILFRLAMDVPRAGDLSIIPLKLLLLVFERVKAWRSRAILFNCLRDYGYWRGVRDMIGSRKELLAIQSDAPDLPLQRLEVKDGLPADLAGFWADGPSLVAVMLDGRPVGTMLVPGPVEAPLRPYLARLIEEQLGGNIYQALIGDIGQRPQDTGCFARMAPAIKQH